METETSRALPGAFGPSALAESFYAFSESIDSFLEEVARVTLDREQSLPPTACPGTEFAGRYRLERPLGRGAHGICWVATDSISNGDVAIKLIASSSARHAARIRAEIGSLRSIRAPGVIELLDEGLEHGSVFIAMPLVLGAPFPAKRIPLRWEDLEVSASRLLQTLAQVHAAGIVHRDLKPANVLVDSNGVPIVLDFGLSVPGFFGCSEDTRHIVGTPAYLAPEQIDGRAVDGRADLYAVGVMLYQSLSGRLPHYAEETRTLLAAKFGRPPALLDQVPGLPEHVASTIDALLSPSPADRPASATETLRLLREPNPGPKKDVDPSISTLDLVGRSAADRAELRRLVPHAQTNDPDSTREAVDAAKQLASEGELALAIALLSDMLTTLSRNPEPHVEKKELVLGAWVLIALVDGSPGLLDRSLYELCQNGSTTPYLSRLEALVRAALSVGAWTDRALDLASTIPPFDGDRDLELERRSIQVHAARRASAEREEQVIETIRYWRERQNDPVVDAHFCSWLGRLRYRQGRFLEAAELHELAAAGPIWSTPRARSIMHAASARMEAFQLEEAAVLAERANTFFQRHRNAKGCAQAGWFVRTIGYRRGETLSADERWIDQVAQVGLREMEGMACLTEAAIAWRSGDLGRGAQIASRGLRVWKTMGERAGAQLLTSGIALACAELGTVAPSDAEAIAVRAIECKTPGVAIQVLALIAKHRATPTDGAEIALANQVPRANWHQCIDVVSVEEALSLLGTTPQ